MTDIVERLRYRPADIDEPFYPLDLCREAAEEIQRLREKMREIAHCEHCEGGDHLTLADMGETEAELTKVREELEALKYLRNRTPLDDRSTE